MANKNPNTSGLKPFQKGVSGNPNGRPPKSFDSLSKSARQYLQETFGTQIIQAIGDGLTSKNEKLRVRTALDLLAYISPKPKATGPEKSSGYELTDEDKQVAHQLLKQIRDRLKVQEDNFGPNEDRGKDST